MRRGRLTRGQKAALEELLPQYQLPADEGPLDLCRIFQGRRPVILEIGFGSGDSLAEQARQNPQAAFIGVEVYPPGLGHLALKLKEADLQNVRVICGDGRQALASAFGDNCLDRVQVFFPDPWPKARHHKRRLVNRDFLRLVKRPLAPGGVLHLATDWRPYGEAMQALLIEDPDFQAAPAPARPCTRFETRGRRLGHGVIDLAYALRKP